MSLRPRLVRTWLSVGSSALLILSGSAAATQSGKAANSAPSPPDQPLDCTTEKDMPRKELTNWLLSGAGPMPECLLRLMNPFSPCGGLSGTMTGVAVFTSTPGVSPEHAAVSAVWSQVDATWNARDAERFSRLFADDASFRFMQRDESLDGRTAIFEHFREGFPRYAPDLRHRTRIDTIQPIAPDVVAADGEVEILRLGGGNDAAPTVLRTFAIFAMMSRNDESWSIRALRIYELSPAADDPG